MTLIFATLWLVALLHVARGAGLETPSAPFLDLTVLGKDMVRANFSAGNDLIGSDGSSILVTDGGSAIHSYKVEWDTDPGVQEVQTIKTSNYIGVNEIQTIATSTAGINEEQIITTSSAEQKEIQRITVRHATTGSYFFLKLDTTSIGGSVQFSGDIQVHADPNSSSKSSVKSIIEAMKNVASHVGFGLEEVGVSRTDMADGTGYYYDVTFPASMGNVPLLEPFTDKLLPYGEATAEISTIEEGNIISGSFRLIFEGQTTFDIPFDASESELQTRVEALEAISTVKVTKNPVDNQRGYVWTIIYW